MFHSMISLIKLISKCDIDRLVDVIGCKKRIQTAILYMEEWIKHSIDVTCWHKNKISWHVPFEIINSIFESIDQ